jgi:hypothetical protein
MMHTIRTDELRRGDIITEDRPRPRRLRVNEVTRTEITHQGTAMPVLLVSCTDGSGRHVKLTSTAGQTRVVLR